MTWSGDNPDRSNRSEWTAYEREANGGVGFDYDAVSDRTGHGVLLNHPTDWEDLTILHGLSVEEDEE